MKLLETRFPYHVVGTFLLLSATLVASRVTADRKVEDLVFPLESIPLQIGGFTGIDNPPLSDSVLRELKASSYISRRYRAPGVEADLFIAFYSQQRAGESMHSPKHCLPGSGWEIWNYDTAGIQSGGGQVTVNKYSISRAGERCTVLYWYQSRERIVASEYLGKLLLARDALLHNGTAASIVRILVPDEPHAVSDAGALAARLIPELQRCFGR
jgi:EpsI family protein